MRSITDGCRRFGDLLDDRELNESKTRDRLHRKICDCRGRTQVVAYREFEIALSLKALSTAGESID